MPVRSESASVMRVFRFIREEVTPLSLTDTFKQDAERLAQPTVAELSYYERTLLEEVTRDIKHQPSMNLSIFRRKGVHVFVIQCEGSDPVPFAAKNVVARTFHRSSVKPSEAELRSPEELSTLQRMIKRACEENSVEYVGDGELEQHPGCYGYWVRYPAA